MLNANYVMPLDEMGQQYPALQAVNYQPRPNESIKFAFSDESADLLSEEAFKAFQLEEVETFYGDSAARVNQINADFRVILLGMPSLFVYDKDEKRYEHLRQGMKLAKTNKVTATRLLCAILLNDEIVLDSNGSIQLFTLKLTSTKTKLLSGDRNDPDFRSMRQLNQALLEHYKLKRGSVLHLVSVELAIKPEKFTSRESGQASWGIMFSLEGNAKPLTEENQALLYHLCQTEEVQDFLKDPFYLKARSEGATADPSGDTADLDADISNIPF